MDYNVLELIEYLIPVVVGIISCIVTFVRTGKIKTINKEVKEMKYRIPSYREKEEPKATTYNLEVPQYRLNKQTGELVELPTKKNLQEALNSFRDVALTDVIERYMPVDQSSEAPVLEAYEYNSDRLDALLIASEYACELRKKYGYSDTATLSDMIADLQAKNEKIVQTIKNATVKEETKNESKENVEKKQ